MAITEPNPRAEPAEPVWTYPNIKSTLQHGFRPSTGLYNWKSLCGRWLRRSLWTPSATLPPQERCCATCWKVAHRGR